MQIVETNLKNDELYCPKTGELIYLRGKFNIGKTTQFIFSAEKEGFVFLREEFKTAHKELFRTSMNDKTAFLQLTTFVFNQMEETITFKIRNNFYIGIKITNDFEDSFARMKFF